MLSECLIYFTFVFLCLFYVKKEMIKKKPSRPVFHSAYERVGVKVSFRRAVYGAALVLLPIGFISS